MKTEFKVDLQKSIAIGKAVMNELHDHWQLQSICKIEIKLFYKNFSSPISYLASF